MISGHLVLETDGTLDDNGSGWFHDLRQSLMEPGWEGPDVYYVLGDFASYREMTRLRPGTFS
jgi:starch phosphorylase